MADNIIDLTESPRHSRRNSVISISSDDEPPQRQSTGVRPGPDLRIAGFGTNREKSESEQSSLRRKQVQRERLEELAEPENVNSHANSLLAPNRAASSSSNMEALIQKQSLTSLQNATMPTQKSQLPGRPLGTHLSEHYRSPYTAASGQKTLHDSNCSSTSQSNTQSMNSVSGQYRNPNRNSASHQRNSTELPNTGSRAEANKESPSRDRSSNTLPTDAKFNISSNPQINMHSKTTSPAPPINERARPSGQLGDGTQTTATPDSRDARAASSGRGPNDDQTTQANGDRGREIGGMTKSQGVKSQQGEMVAPASSASSRQVKATTKPREQMDPTKTPPSLKMTVPIRQFPRSVANGADEAVQPAASGPVNGPPNPASTEPLSSDAVMHEMVDDGPPSMARVEEILMNHIAELHEDHACFVKSTLPRHRRCYDREVKAKKAGSSSPFCADNPNIPQKFLQKQSPFASMKGIQVPTAAKPAGSKDMTMDITQEIMSASTHTQSHSHSQKGLRSYLSIPVTKYESTAINVPPYSDYLSLRDNVLAENNKKLLYWPYFAEEENEEKLGRTGLWEELDERFDMVNEHRPRRLLQAEQCRVHRPYAQTFLEELGINWSHILFWLLSQEDDIAKIEPACKAAANDSTSDVSLLLKRDPHCEEDFDRGHKKWIMVLSSLPNPSTTQLTLAAFACTAFLKLCKFSLWHIARQSETAQSVLSAHIQQSQVGTKKKSELTYRIRACRICHLHDCYYHGEIRENPDSDVDDTDTEARSSNTTRNRRSSDTSVENSSVQREAEDGAKVPASDSESDIVNYKKHVNAKPRKRQDDTLPNGNGTVNYPKISLNHWLTKTKTYMLHERRPFYPCSHEGTCEEARCRCFRENIACEKTCACPLACTRRYRGCSCARDPKGRVCARNPKCECVRLNRECDADLCGTCGAADVLDPVNRYNEAATKGKCTNVHIQRNLPKRTLLGHSEVQGFGLYTGENVKAGDYLGEYKGEVITVGESERRGAIYQHLKTNYLFSLNKEQELDSTRAGNKFRFINNSCDDKIINCKPHVKLCNSVTRIGMFAERDIKIGEELFFNYGYPKDVTKGFWEKGQGPNGKRKPGSSQLVTVKSKKAKTIARTGGASTLKKQSKASSSKMKAPNPRAESTNGQSSSKPTRSSSKPRRHSSKPRSEEQRRAQTQRAREARLRNYELQKAGKSASPKKHGDQGRSRVRKDPSTSDSSPVRPRKRQRRQSPTNASRKRIEEKVHDEVDTDDADVVTRHRKATEKAREEPKAPKAAVRSFEGISEIPETSDDESYEENVTSSDDSDDEEEYDSEEVDAVAGHEEDSDFDSDEGERRRRARERDPRLRNRARSESRKARPRRQAAMSMSK